ncbi:MAG: hypothetical protein CMH83_17010 [Nocardioides sp.]|nr:hypothetical protein [Nocardioides sp.]
MLGSVSELREYAQERKGFWHEPGGQRTSEAIALDSWARAAQDLLVEVAGRYHATIAEHELAERLQDVSGIRTTRPFVKWMAKVLVPLSAVLHREGSPPLTTLVVDGRGWVGETYQLTLVASDRPVPGDSRAREQQAARDRLECYRWAGSAPEDGGQPAPVAISAGGSPRARSTTPRTTSGTTRRTSSAGPAKPAAPKRVAASDRPVAVCPTCFMALPATGVCDNCD